MKWPFSSNNRIGECFESSKSNIFHTRQSISNGFGELKKMLASVRPFICVVKIKSFALHYIELAGFTPTN